MSWVAWIALASLAGNGLLFFLIYQMEVNLANIGRIADARKPLVDMIDGLAADCAKMRRAVIEQEELVARVWLKTIGHEPRKEGDWWHNTNMPLSSYFGMRPAWHLEDHTGVVPSQVSRDAERPWCYDQTEYEMARAAFNLGVHRL